MYDVAAPNIILSPPLSPVQKAPVQERLVSQVALKALAKVSAALAFNGVIINFVAAPSSMVLFSWSLTAVLTVALISFVAKRALSPKMVSCLDYAGDLSLVNNASILGPGIAIHELGHALAGTLLFEDANPSISISPFRGGVTSLNLRGALTEVGRAIGLQNAMALVAAAGLMASTLWAMLELGIAYYCRESSPSLSHLLKTQAFSQLLNDWLNGLGALNETPNPSNDLTRVQAGIGLNPVIPLSLMLILPVIELLALKIYSWASSSSEMSTTSASSDLL